jgi:hypothetical protein
MLKFVCNTALDLLRDMQRNLEEANTAAAVTIYRRNLQRAYIEHEYLMKEEIKPGRSGDYYNVAQSDLRALVRGELSSLKSTLIVAKAKR